MLKEDKEFAIKMIDVIEILHNAAKDYKTVYEYKVGEELDEPWYEVIKDCIFDEIELLLESVVNKMDKYNKSFEEVIEENRRLVGDM